MSTVFEPEDAASLGPALQQTGAGIAKVGVPGLTWPAVPGMGASAVPVTEPEAAEPEDAKVDSVYVKRQVIQQAEEDPTWYDEPSIPRQAILAQTDARFKRTVRAGPWIEEVFDLAETEQAAAYNALLARFTNPDNPTAKLIEIQKQFHEGRFIRSVQYCKYQFKKIKAV